MLHMTTPFCLAAPRKSGAVKAAADRADPRKARPAALVLALTATATMRRRTAEGTPKGHPGGASARPPQGRWGSAGPLEQAWRFPRPQRGGETGKGLGRTYHGRQAEQQKRKHQPRKPPVINPRRAGTALNKISLLGGLRAPKQRDSKARRVEPTVHQNGGTTGHASATAPRGNHKEND